jgi:hypothetical protein
MKNIVLFFCCLMMHITMYCMELTNQDASSKNVNYKEKEQILINDCKDQLKNRLEIYKTSGEFTPQIMDNILGVLSFITNGSENSVDYVHQTKDDELNGFFQHALKKTDLPGMKWLIEKGNIKYHSEKEYADFIAFCTEQLSPTVDQSKRDTAYTILKSIIEHYKTDAGFLKLSKEYYLPIMIMLELKHRALKTKFTIEEDLLTPFVQQNQAHNVNGLFDMYQTIVDVDNKDNNTLAHIIVEQNDADELHILMKKNYISKETRNNAGKTVHELAFDKLRAFTQNTALISGNQEKYDATRCCYFMLEKYFAENDFDKKRICCEKHPVLKRYGADLLKQSSSASVSSSVSSSSELLASLEKPKVLADEPKNNGCCAQLINYIRNHEVIRF